MPTEKLDITFLANAFETDDGYGHVRYIDGPSATDLHHINWDGANTWQDQNNGQALKVKYTASAFDLLSITTRNDFETDFKNDGEFGPLPMGDQVFYFDNTTWSQELRLMSNNDSDPWQWLAGLYYFEDENNALAEFFGQSRKTRFDSRGYALFGQTTYTFWDRLHLTAGLRYDYLDVDGCQQNNMAAAPYGATVAHEEFLPKAVAAYDITEEIMGYVTVARGLLAGGYNYAFAGDASTLTFDPEMAWNYEIGLKTRFWKNKVTLNAAKAHSQGAEVELVFRPFQGMRIFGGSAIPRPNLMTGQAMK